MKMNRQTTPSYQSSSSSSNNSSSSSCSSDSNRESQHEYANRPRTPANRPARDTRRPRISAPTPKPIPPVICNPRRVNKRQIIFPPTRATPTRNPPLRRPPELPQISIETESMWLDGTPTNKDSLAAAAAEIKKTQTQAAGRKEKREGKLSSIPDCRTLRHQKGL